METKILEKMADKISHYDFINFLIPGFALCFALNCIGYEVLCYDFVTNVALCYIAGLINSRLSSVVVEGLAKSFKLIEWRDYSEFKKAREVDSRLDGHSARNNMYRSFVSVWLVAIISYFFKKLTVCWVWLSNNELIILFFSLLILFLFSYRKQNNDYVVKNIDETLKKSNNK